jgi:hypothetical protein
MIKIFLSKLKLKILDISCVSKNKGRRKIIYPNNLLYKGISILKDYFDDKEFVD